MSKRPPRKLRRYSLGDLRNVRFATIVAGITVRADTLGVTSIVRALNLRPKLYHRLLAHFHSTGVKLDRLAALWAQAVLGLFPSPVRACTAQIEAALRGRLIDEWRQ